MKLRKIDKECEKNPVLAKRLEFFAKRMINQPLNIAIAKEFIEEYKKAKKELKL